MTFEEENTALKAELNRVLECAFRMKEIKAGWRFSFRVSNKTYDYWNDLLNNKGFKT